MIKLLRCLSPLLLGLALVACGAQPVAQAPQGSADTDSSPAASPPPATAVVVVPTPTIDTAAQPTAAPSVQATPVPTAEPTPSTTVSIKPSITPSASTTAAPAGGQVVLQVPAGNTSQAVGITAQAGPSTFRVAADGSLRFMDPVNKRLMFFEQGQAGANGKLQRTIDLASLQRPSDFAVSSVGDVFVLDVDGWALAMFTMDGTVQNVMPLHPSLRGLFSTISLTADGSLWGVGENTHYSLISDTPTSPADVTQDATFAGTVTVRSAAYFSVGSRPENAIQSVLSISNVGDGTPIHYDLGQLDGRATFLDVNQGMEPYLLVQKDTVAEVRRYSVQGHLLGTLVLDQRNCRPTAGSVYVDRPGDVYVMCVNDNGATITRYAITDGDGQALPLFDRLVTTAPWSPAILQAAPG